jgi:hypothetical protein
VKLAAQFLDKHCSLTPLDKIEVASLVHRCGVNLRYLGQVFKHSQEHRIRIAILLEIVSRFLKRQLRTKWRQIVQISSFFSLSTMMQATADFLNIVFGQTDDSRAYWENTIRPGIEKSFRVPSGAKNSALYGSRSLYDAIPHALLLRKFRRGLFALKNHTDKEQELFFARQATSGIVSFAATDISTILAYCKAGPLSFPYLEDAKCALQLITDAHFLPSEELAVDFAVVELYKRALQDYDIVARIAPSDAYSYAKWGQAIVALATSQLDNLIARKAISEDWQLCRLFTASGKLGLALTCMGPLSSKPPSISSSAFLSARLCLAELAQAIAERSSGMNQSGGIIDKAYAFTYFQYVSLLEHYHPNLVSRHLSKALDQHRSLVLRRRASVSHSNVSTGDVAPGNSKSVAQLLASVSKCTESTAVVEIHRDAIGDICNFFRVSNASADELFWFHSIKGMDRALRVRFWPASSIPASARGRSPSSSVSTSQQARPPTAADRLREQDTKRQRRRSNSFSQFNMPRPEEQTSESQSAPGSELSKSPSQRTIDLAVSRGTLTKKLSQHMSSALRELDAMAASEQPSESSSTSPPLSPRAASPPPSERRSLMRQTSTDVLRYSPKVNAHQLPEPASPLSPRDKRDAVPKAAGAVSVPPAPSIRKSRDAKMHLEISSASTDDVSSGVVDRDDSLLSPRSTMAARKSSANAASTKPPFDVFFRDSASGSLGAKSLAGEKSERLCYASVSFTDAAANSVAFTMSHLSEQAPAEDSYFVKTFLPTTEMDLQRERASLSISIMTDPATKAASSNIAQRRVSDAASSRADATLAESFVRSDDADIFEEYSHGIVATLDVGAHKVTELALLRFYLGRKVPAALSDIMPNLLSENVAIIRAMSNNTLSLSAVAHNYQSKASERNSVDEVRCLLQVAAALFKEFIDDHTPSNIIYDYAVVCHDLSELMEDQSDRLELLHIACKHYSESFDRFPDTSPSAMPPMTMGTMRGGNAMDFERKLEARASCLADWAAALGEIYNMQTDPMVQDEFASQMLDLILRAYQIFPRGQVKVRTIPYLSRVSFSSYLCCIAILEKHVGVPQDYRGSGARQSILGCLIGLSRRCREEHSSRASRD